MAHKKAAIGSSVIASLRKKIEARNAEMANRPLMPHGERQRLEHENAKDLRTITAEQADHA